MNEVPLVTTKKMLIDAQKGKYAVGAFNVENLEMLQAVVAAAEELESPLILQTTPSTIKYGSLGYYYAMAKVAAEEASVPVAIHLDHGSSYELAMRALRVGYTSIMIDGSHSMFNDNIHLSRSVVNACMPSDVPVEAELGKVGGKEDDLDGGSGGYTDPLEAKEFVEKTKISSLAVAIGTAHGIYSGVPKLDLELLSEIRKVVQIPLVLHGASGLSDDSIQESILRGICKVNFATELRIAFSQGVKKILGDDPDIFDPKKYNAVGRENVKQLVMNRMKVCGCVGKAR